MSDVNRPIKLMLTGGGTGGHLFPAIAAAEELCIRNPGSKVVFVGTRRKMDKTSLMEYGYEVKSIFCYGLKGKSIPHLIKAIAVLPVSLFQALLQIIMFKPDVVIGVGGYVTGPVVAAARFLGKKTVIHEQNSIPGMANRKLGKLAGRICISLRQSKSYFPEEKVVFTGNPVRRPILKLAEKFCSKKEKNIKTLLVLGGSQGAHRLNELVSEALCKRGISIDYKVIHQTGLSDCDVVRQKYLVNNINAQVKPFFKDMAEIYEEADLLVSRAGATTLAELAVLGKPAILVPYPYAADNHQQKNAEYYVEGGGCRVFVEKDLTGQLLAEQIEELLTDNEKREKMAVQMRKLALPSAAAKIVDVCMEHISV